MDTIYQCILQPTTNNLISTNITICTNSQHRHRHRPHSLAFAAAVSHPVTHSHLTCTRLQLCKYQEQSQLLDVWLESMVGPLAGLLRKQAVALHAEACANNNAASTSSLQAAAVPRGTAGEGAATALGTVAAGSTAPETSISPSMQRLFALARLLNVLITVRGYKTVVRGLRCTAYSSENLGYCERICFLGLLLCLDWTVSCSQSTSHGSETRTNDVLFAAASTHTATKTACTCVAADALCAADFCCRVHAHHQSG